jgi:hypothetical protein
MSLEQSTGPRAEKGYGYMRCPCCKRRRRIYVGEIWRRPHGADGSLRIVWPDRDGAIVEQIERPQDGRFGMSYRDLIAGFVKEAGND